MSLMAQYERIVRSGDIEDDAAQRVIIDYFQAVIESIDFPKSCWRIWQRKLIQGIYLYGSVGVGKTFLVDLFYDNLKTEKKARFHFHHFMQQIDAQLRKLQGTKDPLRQIAKGIAKTTCLLCFDEFLVDDVAYAMILAELLQALVLEGVTLVISSNTKPDDLYLNGVQRKRFLPAITLIKHHCHVLNLQIQKDYRLGREPLLNAYLFPLNKDTEQTMEKQFLSLESDYTTHGEIVVQQRSIPYLKSGHKSIWFTFDVLCNFPRSQLDYLELADRFDNVFISRIPRLTINHTAQAIMLINLIDVMYDRGIKLVVTAEVAIDELYTSGEMQEPFKRTKSRLKEMQSIDYLRRHPKRVVSDMRI